MRTLVLLPELCPALMAPVFLKLVMALKNSSRILHCGESFAAKHDGVLAQLRAEGVEIHQGAEPPIDEDSFLLYYGPSRNGPIFDVAQNAGAKVIVFVQHTDGQAAPPRANEFVLYNHEMQMFESVQQGEYFLDEQKTPLSVKSAEGGEGAVVGLLLVDEYFERRTDKAALRTLAAEKLGFDPKSNRPLVFHHASVQHLAKERDRGLTKLAAQGVDVLVGAEAPLVCEAEGQNIFKCADKSLFNLLAYASDAVLPAVIEPGDLTFSVMAGLHCIPVYTDWVYLSPEDAAQNRKSSFTLSLRPDPSGRRSARYAIISALPPISMPATDLITQMLRDEEYWAKYDECLPVIHKNAFGRYLMGDKAFLRSAQFINRLLKTGALAPPIPERVTAPAPIRIYETPVLL